METTDIKIKYDLAYEEKPVYMLDYKERVIRNRVSRLYNVVWSNHGERDATWEREDYLREVYPSFYNKCYVT